MQSKCIHTTLNEVKKMPDAPSHVIIYVSIHIRGNFAIVYIGARTMNNFNLDKSTQS